MRYFSDDASRTGEQNVNFNKNTPENVALNKTFHLDKRALSFIFKHKLLLNSVNVHYLEQMYTTSQSTCYIKRMLYCTIYSAVRKTFEEFAIN